MKFVRALAIVFLGFPSTLAAVAPEWRYYAQFVAREERLDVEVCAPAGEALVLEALDSSAREYLIAPDPQLWRYESGTQILRARQPGCARYSVALGRAAGSNRSEHGHRVGADLLVWPTTWLWWPTRTRAPMRLQMRLPEGWYFSAPWPQPDPAQTAYTLGNWPRYWSALCAFTRRPGARIEIGKGRLNLAVLGDLPAEQRAKLQSWVTHLGGLLEHVVGGLPLPQVQVLVVPTKRGAGPVPWGQVYRGGLGGVHFFVDATRPRAEFIADWTGAHEISHLLHPYLGARGSWMGEGLASYLQNVLRARAGTLSPTDAWERLIAGFERGRKDTAQNQALAEVAQGMQRSRAYMRVYWSGAAFWLAADVELRRRSAGKLSLDTALTRFAACCLPALRPWTPLEFAHELDRQLGETLFVPAVERAAAAENFPDLNALYAALGIELDARRQVTGFDDHAANAAIRQSIMAVRTN